MNTFITNNQHDLKRVRNIRNELLNKTDRYFLIDYPIAYEHQIIIQSIPDPRIDKLEKRTKKIKDYRQDLRDFINNNEIKILAGEKVEFPKQPDFIDLNIIY